MRKCRLACAMNGLIKSKKLRLLMGACAPKALYNRILRPKD